MIVCMYRSNLWIYRYWGDEHSYSTSAVNIRDGGIVQKSQETVEPLKMERPLARYALSSSPEDRINPLLLLEHAAEHRGNVTRLNDICNDRGSAANDNTGGFVDRTAQDDAADRPVPEDHPKLTDTNQVSSADDTLEIVSNKDDNGDSLSILSELVDILSEKDGEPPHVPSRTGNRPLEGGLRFPLCVLDPFIQKKVILLLS